MRVAVVGSRGLVIDDLGEYLPEDVTEIVSGGASGVDRCARRYARAHGITLTEFLPEYKRFGRAAPIKRNILIIENADIVLAFWDGTSHGTKFMIDSCKKMRIPFKVFTFNRRTIDGVNQSDPRFMRYKNRSVPEGSAAICML